ncbi:MAG: Gldg family protein, partial [Dehalococcoidia bacterium]
GLLSITISVIFNISKIKIFLFSSKGLYSANTFFILIGTLIISILINSVIYVSNKNGVAPSWFRSDLTASKEYDLSSQALNAIENLNENMEIFMFHRNDSSKDAISIKRTEDLLSEFSRNSNKNSIKFKYIDPDLDPNLSSNLNIERYLSGRDLPILVFRLEESQRLAHIVGKDPNESINIFNEKDVISGILISNQVKKKRIFFLSGHEERDINNLDRSSNSLGQAKVTLERDNYDVSSITTDELSRIILNFSLSNELDLFPAAIIISDPSDEILDSEKNVIQEYISLGGNIMLLLEPDSPKGYIEMISSWGIISGEGTLIDRISYVAPNLEFLQIKDSNSQIPDHPITHNFDVIYFPGSKFIGLSLMPEEIPITDEGVPYIKADPIAYTTISSWEETSREIIEFNQDDISGPLPVALAVEAIASIKGNPLKQENGEYLKSKMTIFGDTDFASNRFLFSAKNEDLFANSINWLTSDVELISIRPKVKVFRELVLTEDERNFVRWSGWIFLPALSLSLGFYNWWRRR